MDSNAVLSGILSRAIEGLTGIQTDIVTAGIFLVSGTVVISGVGIMLYVLGGGWLHSQEVEDEEFDDEIEIAMSRNRIENKGGSFSEFDRDVAKRKYDRLVEKHSRKPY